MIDLSGPARLWPQPELRRWRDAAIRALSDVDPSMRAPVAGDELLRSELARLLGGSADNLVVTGGARNAAVALMAGRSEVILERPTFLGIRHALVRSGVRVRTQPWAVMAAAARPGDGLWFTTPGRNPDGLSAGTAFLDALADHARAGCRVVCNLAYRWFASTPALPAEIVQVGTLHKLAGKGAGLGWIAAGDLEAQTVARAALAAPPWHWQRTWARFLAGGGAELLLARHQDLDEARGAFFAAMGYSTPDEPVAGPNVLLAVPGDERETVAALGRSGVRVSPGSAFDAPFPAVRACFTGVTVDQATKAGEIVSRLLPPK